MENKKITFFHSTICPRCFVAGQFLSRILQDHPGIEVEKVEILTNRRRSREAGVSTIPALACEGKTISGFLLGPGRIREFVESIENG